jgi:hypothetical protein
LTSGDDIVRFSFIIDCKRLNASVNGVARLFVADKLAPARRRTPTIANRPLIQAKCNGVFPSESSALTSAP